MTRSDTRNIPITDLLLNKFFMDEATPEEIAAIRDWATASPENGERFQKAFDLYAATTVALAKMQDLPAAAQQPRKARRWLSGAATARRRRLSLATAAAAALLFGMFLNHQIATRPLRQAQERIAARTTAFATAPGQRVRITLPDGTVVDLNSGSRIEYPPVFLGKTRPVKLSGEAMFDVAKNAGQPFVVQTYACDVTVTGTRFNVVADEARSEFSTALLEGRVTVRNRAGGAPLAMQPGQEVRLKDGALSLQPMRSPDDYLWTDGIVSIAGVPFDRLMRTFERCYGVRIVLDRPDLPEIHYAAAKVRISDGIVHAFDLLRKRTDFTYEYDEINQVYHIR